jgi:hypothetical protein
MFDHETEMPGELEDAEERDRVLRELSETKGSTRPSTEEKS